MQTLSKQQRGIQSTILFLPEQHQYTQRTLLRISQSRHFQHGFRQQTYAHYYVDM